jgi:hypothetical protein
MKVEGLITLTFVGMVNVVSDVLIKACEPTIVMVEEVAKVTVFKVESFAKPLAFTPTTV